MLAESHMALLPDIAPASFFDLRHCRSSVRGLMFRTRNPFKSSNLPLIEKPYLSKLLPFSLSAIMSGTAQVGLVIYHPVGMTSELLANCATIATASARKGLDVGEGRPAIKLNDIIIFDFASRNALVALRVDKKG